jgi:hypothetical protein
MSYPPAGHADGRQALAADEAELFAMLVPAEEQEQLHSFDGIVARGRMIFRQAFLDTRDTVCPLYRRKAGLTDDEAQLVMLIAGSLLGQAVLGGVPVVPLAALMVKIGLAQLCAEAPRADGA